jgi:sec-independent protein translocase protein TatA
MVRVDLGDLLSPLHLGILLVVVLLIFGPRRLPELGGAVGKTIQSFRRAMHEEAAPPPAAPPAPVSPEVTATGQPPAAR